MMMNPPGAGDDFSVPCSAVAHRHGAGFSQGLGRDGVTCRAEAAVHLKATRGLHSQECKGPG